MNTRLWRCCYFVLLLLMSGLLMPDVLKASGTWTALANRPPAGINNSLLLSDGTVICGDGGQNWYRLKPDIHGSYANGAWSQIASMTYGRLFYSSDVLTNGNVYVAGGEYGSGRNFAELYDSLANTWTVIPQPPGIGYSDAESKILPGGNVLQSDSQSGIYIYNAASNVVLPSGSGAVGDQNEAGWVRLPNDNIVTIDAYGQNSEHYVPSLNQWFPDANLPVALFGFGGELGPGFVLPNGNAFYIGATTNTAIYTPGGSLTSAGSWVAGPLMVFGTNQLGAVDAPAAMMANGKILCDLGPNSGFGGPIFFYEYDYVSNSFTQVNGPNGVTENNAPFASSMLDLPDGSILFIDGQGTTSLYVYKPDGTPLAAGQPVINSISENTNGTYHLTGIGLNGVTGGAAYGDDWQMDTSYPLVRMTNISSGNVYYARTYGWSSTTIQNPNPVTTEFSLPANLPAGTYSLVVTANGNPSAPVTFTYAPPAAPTGLAGTAGNAGVILSWNAVSGATAYNVKRLTTNTPPYFATVATVTGTSFTNTGLVNAISYFYVVTAIGSGGESANPPSIFLTPFGTPPIPAGVTAASDTFARIDLAWTPSFAAASYNVKRSATHGGPYVKIASPLNPFYTDSGLVSGAIYYYVVSALSAAGESADSAEVSAPAQAVANLGFETPGIGSGNFQYAPAGGFWTFNGVAGNGSGILANGSAFGNPNALEGTQAGFVQSNGVISQVLSGFTPGTTYTITYAAAQRPGQSESWNVKIDNTVIQANSPGGAAYVDYTATFVATAINHTLSFVGTDIAGGDNTVFIDNVRLGVAQSAVANGSFETPGIGGGNFQYNPSGTSWTFTGGNPSGSGIVANSSGFGNPNAPNGVQAAFVQEFGTISQTISGFVPGTSYAVNYTVAQRSGGNQHGGESWNVKIDNTVIQSNSPGGTSYGDYTATFVASATTHTLSFVGTDLAGGDNTVFLDNVSLISTLQPVAPTVTLNSPTNGAVIVAPATVSLQAAVVTNGNVINSVQYYDDLNNLIGQVSAAPYNLSWSNVTNGSHNVFARVVYNGGSVMDSAAAGIIVVNNNVNFSFELPTLGNGNYQYNPAGGSWGFGGQSGIVANGSAFGNPNSPQGTQAAFVQSFGAMSEELAGFTPGTNYTITYSAAQRGGNAQSWNVMIDNTVIEANNPGGTAYSTHSVSFMASAATHTLSFVGTDLNGGDNTVFIDNISLNPSISSPAVATNTLPATALNVVGDQVVFMASFTSASPISYQWQMISGGVTNNIFGATNTVLTLTNLQLANTASYQLRASNASGFAISAPGSLTVSNVPAAVSNVVTELAAQTGLGPSDALGFTFVPTWTVTTNNSLIAGKSPAGTVGNFSLEVPGRNVNSLTAGGNGSIAIVTATTGFTSSTNYVTCGNGGGAGSSVIYSLTGSATGYNLSNITVYGGWGDAGRDQQAYTVYYSMVGAPSSFIRLTSVNYNPANPANVQSATRATLMPFSGALATNVAAVRFDFTTPASENGYCGYSQVAVFGTLTPPSVPAGLSATATNSQVNLTWTASAGATSYNVKSSTNNGGPYTVISNVAGAVYTDAGLSSGVTYYYVVSALNSGGESANSSPVNATPGALPPPWLATDVDAPVLAGSANYSGGTFTLNGSGTDISGTNDQFQFAYQPVVGNCDIRARVVTIQNTAPGAKAGVMIRETLDADSRSSVTDATPGDGAEFITRASTGGDSSSTVVAGPGAPYWVRLVRNKNTFTSYSSPDGINWTKMGLSQTIPMTPGVYVGLVVCAQNNGALCAATFDNVALPAPPGNVYASAQLTPGFQSGGVFTLQFQGVSDLNYTVETSTNLIDWSGIFTNALIDADGGIFTFTNTNATDPARFYRIVQ